MKTPVPLEASVVVPVSISVSALSDAIKGIGLHYPSWGWCQVIDVLDMPDANQMLRGHFWQFKACGDATWHKMDWEALLQGLSKMADEYPEHFVDILLGTTSSQTKNLLVQLSIFDTVMYD